VYTAITYYLCFHKCLTRKKDIISGNNSFTVKLSRDSRFQRAFTAGVCVFKVITLVGSNQCNYIENATAFSKRTLKTTVATQL